MATYFVDASRPDDTGDGLSEGTAWKTINKVQTTLTGDQSDTIVKFKRGEVWREQYTVAGSGTSGQPFTHTSYGSGADPIINGCDLMTTWADEGSDVWSTTCTFTPKMVFMDGNFGDKKGSSGACVDEYDWYLDGGANTLYVWCDNVSGPDSEYTSPGVEATRYPTTDGQGLIYFPASRNYVTVDGLEVKQSQEVGIDMRSASSYLTIKNNTVSYCWHGGIDAWGSIGGGCSYITIQNNTVHDVEIMGVSGYNEAITVAYTDTFEISGNTVYNCGAKECIDAKQNSFDGEIFDNTVYDSRIGIYLDSVSDILVYRNIIYGQDWQGILLSNELDNRACDSIDIYYNIIYSVSDGIKYYAHGGSTNHISNIDVYNNTIYGCDNAIKFDTGVETRYSGINNIKNNILWALGSTYGILDISATEQGIANTTIDYNCFRTGSTSETFGSNPVMTTDAKFVNAPTDLHIEFDSLCRNAGVDVGLTEDFDQVSVPQETYPAIGAFEFVTSGWASEQIAHAELVGGGETVLHSHAGGGSVNIKCGVETTDGSGNGTVTFGSAFADTNYSISLTGIDTGNTVIAMYSSKATTGFSIRTEDDKGLPEGDATVDWIAVKV